MLAKLPSRPASDASGPSFLQAEECPLERLGPAAALLRSLPVNRLPAGADAPPDLAGLAAVQGSMMRNYFRLLRAQEELERRTHRLHRENGAAVLGQIESERARLAGELHAGAGQALAGIKIHLELLDSFLPDPSEQVRGSLHRIGLLAQQALQQLRSIAQRIHPPDCEHATLGEALARLWDASGIPQRFEAVLEVAPLFPEPPLHVRILLYRIAQEALANTVRHAAATRVRLAVGRHRECLQLTLEDNGRGFDAPALAAGAAPASGGIGLRSMREQLRHAGGELRIESGPRGTLLTARVPVPVST